MIPSDLPSVTRSSGRVTCVKVIMCSACSPCPEMSRPRVALSPEPHLWFAVDLRFPADPVPHTAFTLPVLAPWFATASTTFPCAWTFTVPKIVAQYPKTESKGSQYSPKIVDLVPPILFHCGILSHYFGHQVDVRTGSPSLDTRAQVAIMTLPTVRQNHILRTNST